jgi:ubiquinone/menaquinone biosynthesis C-methylase UbiE
MFSTGTKFDEMQEAYWAGQTNVRSWDHPVVRAFSERRVEFIKQLFADWRPDTALEVGCGDGFGMQRMQYLVGSIHGCDNSLAMLEANPVAPDRLTKADAYALPFGDNSFDLVYCWELLHHVARPVDVVREMARVSSRGVLLCEPNCLNPGHADVRTVETGGARPLEIHAMVYPVTVGKGRPPKCKRCFC